MAILSIGELLGIGPDELSGFVPYTAIGGSGNVISGINGSGLSGAGTDTTTVSAIASSYAESAASGKLDNSASSTWYPYTGNPSGFLTSVDLSNYATTAYVDSSVSSKADASSLTAYQTVDGMSAFQPSGDYAFNSSLSAKADSSALTAYQTVECMSAYQTTGDYAYNSSLSSKVDQSAFDACCSEVQRALSGKADSSALTAYQTVERMSAYQASGDYAYNSSLSSKQDVSSMSAYALSSNVSGVIRTVSSNSASWGAGATGDYVKKGAVTVAIGSANSVLDSALAQGSSNTAYSASLAQGVNNTADAYSFAQGSLNKASNASFAQGLRNSASMYSFAQGSSNNTAESASFAQGLMNSAILSSLAQGERNYASRRSFAQGSGNRAYSASFAQGDVNSASGRSLAQGSSNTAYYGSFAQGAGNYASDHSFSQGFSNSAISYSFAQGLRNSARFTAAVFGKFNLHGDGDTATGDSAAFVIGDGTGSAARHDLMLVTKDGEITMYSSTHDNVGLGIVSSIKAISAVATGGALDSAIPLTSTDHSVIISNQGTYADLRVTGTTGDLTVSGVSILALYRWATSQGYQP